MALIAVVAAAAPAGPAPRSHPVAAAAERTTRVSVSSRGAEGSADSFSPTVSGDGRYVAFSSTASNLVAGDGNGGWGDILLADRRAGRLDVVSVNSGGRQGPGLTWDPAISSNGRFVAFASEVPSLVPGDTNGVADIFVRDRVDATTTRVSVGVGGREANGESYRPSISGDGRFVAFVSDATNLGRRSSGYSQVYLHDRRTGATSEVSVDSRGDPGTADSNEPSISGDGRFVAFASWAANLTPGDTNETSDVFLRNLTRRITTRVSVSSSSRQTERLSASSSPAISADGRIIGFYSTSSTLVPGDTNGQGDVFVRDRLAGLTTRVSVASSGRQGDGDSGAYYGPSLSRDGRLVVFGSQASNLTIGDTNHAGDIFLRDRVTGSTSRVSFSQAGDQGNAGSSAAAISPNGALVTYDSEASNLVPDDTNAAQDVFTRTIG